MGGWISKVWWGGDPDEANPISGLTLRDIYAIQKSWTPVYAKAEKYGLELFRRLFRQDPTTKLFFKLVSNMTEEQFSKNNKFKAHAINFMSTFNMVVVTLKNPEVVVAMMEKLGQSHNKNHIQKKHFDVLKEVFVNFLQNDLRLDKSTLESWTKFVIFIYKHILLQIRVKQTSARF